MRKILLFVTGFILAIVLIYGVTNYHTTPAGAFEELAKSTDATLIPMADEKHVILVEENGDLAVALMETERRFLVKTLYTDFKIFPSNLNVYDAKLDQSVAFLNAPEKREYTYGIVKNEEIKYLKSQGDSELEEPRTVYPLTDYISKSEAEDILIWFYPQQLEKDDMQSALKFLDAKENVVKQYEENYSTEEFFIKNMN